jgi:hypothetical protein
MNEMDLLARMRDNAPRRVSPRVEQTFRAALYDDHHPERARLAPKVRRLVPRGATGRGASRPAWRRLAAAGLPAIAVAVALLLVMLPSGGRPRQGAAPLTAQLLADRAAAVALAGPDIRPGQWVYEELAFTNHFTHQTSIQELWVTADDSMHAGYFHGKFYKEYNGQNLPPGGLPVVLAVFTTEPLAYTALGSLPSEPRALISRLGELGAQFPGPVVGCAENATYCDAFQMITQLFSGYVMPPATAAKLFKAIGDIPGVTVVPGVPGPNGQRGVAFRLRLTTGYQQLILNPVTYKPAGGPWYSSIVRQEPVSGPGVRP